ncbi:MAG: hypothetical protein E2O94_01230 [Alphaproteobacteria bacterium]|nr:MAG: hypothetical protein E2O94_01230 [Alphaproteobacteria bacterium]
MSKIHGPGTREHSAARRGGGSGRQARRFRRDPRPGAARRGAPAPGAGQAKLDRSIRLPGRQGQDQAQHHHRHGAELRGRQGLRGRTCAGQGVHPLAPPGIGGTVSRPGEAQGLGA